MCLNCHNCIAFISKHFFVFFFLFYAKMLIFVFIFANIIPNFNQKFNPNIFIFVLGIKCPPKYILIHIFQKKIDKNIFVLYSGQTIVFVTHFGGNGQGKWGMGQLAGGRYQGRRWRVGVGGGRGRGRGRGRQSVRVEERLS